MDAKRAGKDPESIATAAAADTSMADIRQMLTNFETNELNLYQLRTNSATRQRIWRTSGMAFIAFFAVGLLVVSNSYSFVFVRRQLTKLESAETHIKSVIENILDGMIVVDANGSNSLDEPSGRKNVRLPRQRNDRLRFHQVGSETL